MIITIFIRKTRQIGKRNEHDQSRTLSWIKYQSRTLLRLQRLQNRGPVVIGSYIVRAF